MKRISRQPATFSKLSVGSRTVIPREVREWLELKSGDTLCYRMANSGILLNRAPEAYSPFAVFSEWVSEADEKAYGAL